MNELPQQHLPQNAPTLKAYWIAHLMISLTVRGMTNLIIARTSSCGESNAAGRILGPSIKHVLCAMEHCSAGLGIRTRTFFTRHVCFVQCVVRTTFGAIRRSYLDKFHVLSILSVPKRQSMLTMKFLETSCLVC